VAHLLFVALFFFFTRSRRKYFLVIHLGTRTRLGGTSAGNSSGGWWGWYIRCWDVRSWHRQSLAVAREWSVLSSHFLSPHGQRRQGFVFHADGGSSHRNFGSAAVTSSCDSFVFFEGAGSRRVRSLKGGCHSLSLRQGPPGVSVVDIGEPSHVFSRRKEFGLGSDIGLQTQVCQVMTRPVFHA